MRRRPDNLKIPQGEDVWVEVGGRGEGRRSYTVGGRCGTEGKGEGGMGRRPDTSRIPRGEHGWMLRAGRELTRSTKT